MERLKQEGSRNTDEGIPEAKQQVEVLHKEIRRLTLLCGAHVSELETFKEQQSGKLSAESQRVVYLTSEYVEACWEYEEALSGLSNQLLRLKDSTGTVAMYRETLLQVPALLRFPLTYRLLLRLCRFVPGNSTLSLFPSHLFSLPPLRRA